MAKGTVYVQCGTCETWHQIVDNLNLIHRRGEEAKISLAGQVDGGDAEETGIVPSWDEADSSDASAVAENEHQPSERRSLQMTFTCNSCEGRTTRLVSPNAMAKGTVYVQCGTCETWHQIVDNLNLIHEYNLEDEPEDFPPEEA
eukprot:CAMPEP_0182914926 /NCGR_PEP_ID=MMETSP0034_2-20130328/38821_1 /TAXON_ID=156128 /ORGANISM="Nephroselmis pyriformis, Strain CCMP717" /LENGTH=143 /DNA_ID=CAMNT_0025051717 /DNA_START=299 /DNA_END=731 /DNA_ORIENTATION=+